MEDMQQDRLLISGKDGYIMAIVLTNGKYYITHSNTGKVIKVTDIEQAQDFYSVEKAIRQKNKSPGKCKGYYYMDTSIEILEEIEENIKEKKKVKRKSFTQKERLIVYNKTKGYCYLCGEFVDYNSFEIEHNIPISKGGTNVLENLFCACHSCNIIKHDIYPEDFMEKISKIYLFQMGKKYESSLKWKFLHKLLLRLE